ncbi:hypothetical protein JX266_001767 [Neoarthrinium moseri]|nr:hypothetical protein JX266_001767 [Neoarthrinium moseri]
MPYSRAIWLEPNGSLSLRDIAEHYEPSGAQTLVSVEYSAINPADIKHYYIIGAHSIVAGYEWIGPVLATGPNSPFKKGEMLFGLAPLADRKPLSAGAHQDRMLVEPYMTFRVPPPALSQRGEDWQTQVVSWTAAAHTVCDAFFNCMGFGFSPLGGPNAGKEIVSGVDPHGRAILIWGASSTVGLCAVQLARIAGFSPILCTASPHNHEALLGLGATACFDHRSPSVVSDIRAAVQASGKPLATIFDAVTVGTGIWEPPRAASDPPLDLGKSSPAIAKQCLTEGIAPEEVRLSATLKVEFDEDWKFCMVIRNQEPSPDLQDRIDAAIQWLWGNAANVNFRIPKVKVVQGGDEGIKAIKDVYDGKVSMEKVVIKHPL